MNAYISNPFRGGTFCVCTIYQAVGHPVGYYNTNAKYSLK